MNDERIQPKDADAWGAWLEEHHRRGEGVWLVSWKKHTGLPSPSYEDAVIEALRFGWIDSTQRRLDDDRNMQWFAPRKARSGWARTNKERIRLLIEQDRLEIAGREAMERAKADGSWELLDSVEDLVVPADLEAAFEADRGSKEAWEALPRSVKRAALVWIVQARKDETRARRIEETARLVALGERPGPPSNR